MITICHHHKVKVAEMERSALKAVISLVEESQLIDLPDLLQHRCKKVCRHVQL